MKWLCVKRFFTHVSIHIVVVVLFMGPSMWMKVSWVELSAHVHKGLQLVGHLLESLST